MFAWFKKYPVGILELLEKIEVAQGSVPFELKPLSREIFDKLRRSIKKWKKNEINAFLEISIREPVEAYIYNCLAHAAADEVQFGGHEIYPGVLSIEGRWYLGLFEHAIRVSIESGTYTKEWADLNLRAVVYKDLQGVAPSDFINEEDDSEEDDSEEADVDEQDASEEGEVVVEDVDDEEDLDETDEDKYFKSVDKAIQAFSKRKGDDTWLFLLAIHASENDQFFVEQEEVLKGAAFAMSKIGASAMNSEQVVALLICDAVRTFKQDPNHGLRFIIALAKSYNSKLRKQYFEFNQTCSVEVLLRVGVAIDAAFDETIISAVKAGRNAIPSTSIVAFVKEVISKENFILADFKIAATQACEYAHSQGVKWRSGSISEQQAFEDAGGYCFKAILDTLNKLRSRSIKAL